VLDAFVLSHTLETVEIPDQEKIDAYLPSFEPEYRLDPEDPRTFGGLTATDQYFELRYGIEQASQRSRDLWEETGRQFGEVFGRPYGLVEQYRTEDAELLIIASATIASTARVAVDRLREAGRKVGLLRIRVFRPFPSDVVREVVGRARKALVIDRNISFGASGIFYQEVKAAMYNAPERPPVFGVITGLGGRDVTSSDIEAMVRDVEAMDEPRSDILFRGVKT